MQYPPEILAILKRYQSEVVVKNLKNTPRSRVEISYKDRGKVRKMAREYQKNRKYERASRRVLGDS